MSAYLADQAEWRVVLRPSSDARFMVPEEVTMVRFWAGDYEAVQRSLPDVADGVVELGTVVLAMSDSVLLRVWNAPEELAASLSAEAWVCGQHLCGRAPLRRSHDHDEAELPIVPGSTCELRLLCSVAGIVCNLPREQRYPSASSGRRRIIDVDLALLRTAKVRLVGVPAELLPHVELLWDCDGHRARPVVADARGELCMIGLPRGLVTETSRLYVQTATGGKVALRTLQGQIELCFVDGAELLVEPEEDLLGITTLAPDAPDFQLAIGEFEFRWPARAVHILPAAEFAATGLLSVQQAEAKARRVARQDLVVDGVLRRLPAPFSLVAAAGVAGLVSLLWRARRRALGAGEVGSDDEREAARIAWLLALFVVAWFLSVWPFFAAARYREPIVPALLVLAGGGVGASVRALSRGEWRRTATLALALLFAWPCFAAIPSPQSADAFKWRMDRGRALARQGRHEEALSELERALEVRPSSAEARFSLGLSAGALGREQEAGE
ncbi:MAG: tetratricopeptide repeat protein, partial [Planctomycetes bacterium]|nr:tetratricopeptide repeat protein [Planctomycetota bacterium]